MALNHYRPGAAAILFALQFLLGLALAIGTPLLDAPDELYHWQRAVQVSEGRFLAERAPDGEWGGWIDRGAFDYQIWSLKKFIAGEPIFGRDARNEALGLRPFAGQTVSVPFPSTASFSPVAYLPQAAGIAAAHALHANIFSQIVAGRIANLIAFLCLTALAHRILPVGRNIFLVAMFVPTALALAASLSADAMNLAIPAVLIALCMRLRADPDFAPTPWRKWSIVGLAVACGLLKVIYVVFVLAILLVPATRFIGSASAFSRT